MNPEYHGIWLLLYNWQTLITGFLAVVSCGGHDLGDHSFG